MKKYILFLLLGFQSAFAQIQFEAHVSRATLAEDETLQIDFIMNGDGDNFAPPSFEGFHVVAGQRQWMSTEFRNGRSSLRKGYSYNLSPQRQGVLTIQPATVEINGQIYKSNTVHVRVTAPVQKPRNPDFVAAPAEEAVHLVAEVSNTNPYVNEPITVVYKLYCGYDTVITDYRELEFPKFNDFWSQKIDVSRKVIDGTYEGEQYQYVVLKKVVLYPQKSGKLRIEPYSLDVTLAIPTNRRNVFGQVQVVEDNRKISAGVRTIDVKPLPETGRPAGFTGAVGKFDFKVTPSRTAVRQGESLDLAVTVSGAGNLKLFDIPKPAVPDDIEIYDPVRKDQVNTQSAGMNGKITDIYTIVPGKEPRYDIKPISFSYFDPEAGKYKTITSNDATIRVLDGGLGQPLADESGAKEPETKSDKFSLSKLKSEIVPGKGLLKTPVFYGLIALPLLVIAALLLVRKRKKKSDIDTTGKQSKNTHSLAKKYLQDASKNSGNKELFYISLERALHNFLKSKLDIETSEMSKENIRALLLSRNAHPEAVNDFLRLTENCEFARYAPSSTVSIQHDYDKAVYLITTLEKQL